jgi:hypothetical protein
MPLHGKTTTEVSSPTAANLLITASNALVIPLKMELMPGTFVTAGALTGVLMVTSTLPEEESLAPLDLVSPLLLLNKCVTSFFFFLCSAGTLTKKKIPFSHFLFFVVQKKNQKIIF